MPRFLACALALVFGFTAAAHAQVPAEVEAYRQQAMAECRDAGGTPKPEPDFITERDLNDDGKPDYVGNLQFLTCENAWSYFCGSAGCPVTVWTSGPGGLAVAWSQSAQAIDWDGTTMIAHLHGQFCTPPRDGAEGCTERVAFSGTAPGAAAAPPAKDPAAPSSERWALRQPDGAPPVAVVGGRGNLRSMAAFCLQGQPWLALLLVEPPAQDRIRVDFTFSSGTEWGPAQRGPTTGGAYMIGLAGHKLAAHLAGRDAAFAMAIDGTGLGDISLTGSSKALRAALGGCHSF